ncbi:MAG UNVERIFIED_CONTAM: hypothetical protein LVT10_07330 [Anaerolineae bacterium]|jgi:hypothetical protein
MAKQTHSIELSLEQLLRDREALAVRNRTLAETLHRPSFSQQIRHQWLRLLANSYVPPSRKARNARRILVIRPDHIGDALLATPPSACSSITAPRMRYMFSQDLGRPRYLKM